MKRYAAKIDLGLKHLQSQDPIMRCLIEQCPSLTSLSLERNRFRSLTNSILSQQISVNSARSLRVRLLELLSSSGLKPEEINKLNVEDLRAIGISRQKAHYLLDLAKSVEFGKIQLNQIGRLNDEQIIQELVKVKGIGIWTAQMFLIFSLGRMDVMPWLDFGIRTAIRHLYDLKNLPGKNECLAIAAPWQPYRTIGSWYCWRSHEIEIVARGQRMYP